MKLVRTGLNKENPDLGLTFNELQKSIKLVRAGLNQFEQDRTRILPVGYMAFVLSSFKHIFTLRKTLLGWKLFFASFKPNRTSFNNL